MTEDKKLTTGEVAALLGISNHTVIRWAELGVLPVHRAHPQAHRKFLLSDVQRLRMVQED